MIIINFAHPLTDDHLAQIGVLTGTVVTAVYEYPCQFANDKPLPPQIKALLEQVELSATAWQTAPLLINPPGLAPAAAVLLAEMHGLMGYFPSIIRIRPVLDTTPPRFEVAEILNLQAIREEARLKRQEIVGAGP